MSDHNSGTIDRTTIKNVLRFVKKFKVSRVIFCMGKLSFQVKLKI